MNRILPDDKGQAIVEFAFMLPFFLFMLLFIVEFGYAFYTQILVRNAAAESARYAAVGALPSAACAANSIEDRAIRTSNNLISCGGADSITVTYQNPVGGEFTRTSGVAVRISHTHNTITPLGAIANAISWGTIPDSFSLTACASSRLESKPANQALLTPGSDCG